MPIVKVEREDILREEEFRGMLDKLKGKESIQGTYTLRKRYEEGPKEGERIVQTFNIDCRKTECLLCLLWIFGKRIRFVVLKKHKRGPVPEHYVKRITLEHPLVRYVTSYMSVNDDTEAYLFPGKSRERILHSIVKTKDKDGNIKVRSYEYERKEHGFMSAQKAWKTIKFLDPNAYCHLFRHSLATVMAEHGYTEDQLMNWFDWSSPKVAHDYVQKGPRLSEEASRRTW
jgi:integrase